MQYADVAVDAPLGSERTLSYAVPVPLRAGLIVPGQLVTVPLGTRLVQGIVFGLAAQPQVEPVREIQSAWDPAPLLSAAALDLARWLSREYLCSLFEAAALFLPPGFRSHARAFLSRGAERPAGGTLLSDTAMTALARVPETGELLEAEALEGLGRDGRRAVESLVAHGYLRRRWELSRPRLAPRYVAYLRAGAQPAPDERLTPRQAALLELLVSGLPVGASEARETYGAGPVRSLLSRGLLATDWVALPPSAPRPSALPEEAPPVQLTSHQRAAVDAIAGSIGESGGAGSFLLYGVTGSGKTEVYLQAMARCLALHKRGLFLVPEISLTHQAVHRLQQRFPGRVAVLHSGLTERQQSDQWWRIREGLFDVVVGARSALFAPLPDLGLIVLDEEHEWTYKQDDIAPRYHAREAALRLATLSGAVVVMGSATPDVVTYHAACRGAHSLLTLPDRVVVDARGQAMHGPLAMPLVEVVSMRDELKEGNRSIFSRALAGALKAHLGRGEQALLFLNRRGEATSVQCRDCGYVARCRRCAVALTYHSGGFLLCHHCNARSRPPAVCPRCRSSRIRYLGLGTQRVVEELARFFPDVTSLRWDRDAAPSARDSEELLERFARGEAQVLVGTQMVAKGLHVPSVTLVGVVLADVGLHLPDPRAGERLFQLLCQVSGRAGRGTAPGRAIIQTYVPENYAIQAAARQDYLAFYTEELEGRLQLHNPPFTRLAHLVYVHTDASLCQREAERMGWALRQRAAAYGIAGLELVGPAPGSPTRVRGRYRWHIVLRHPDPRSVLAGMEFPQGWTWDIDPVSVL